MHRRSQRLVSHTRAAISLLVVAMAGCVVAMAGCSDDDTAISHSGPIDLRLNLGPSDVDDSSGALADEKNVTTESGNPCAEFIREAERLLGHEPSSIRIDRITLALADGPTGVAALNDLWSGPVRVSFVFGSDAGSSFAVAQGTVGGAAGTQSLPVTVSGADLDANHAEIVACNYAVSASGAANPSLGDAFDAEVVVTLDLSALP